MTILSTQCYPRSSRPEDSFFDNLTKRCLAHGIGAPAVYMESTENQPAILNPCTNPAENKFQTLRLTTEANKGKRAVYGSDILRVANDVIGNQPSLIIPADTVSRLPIKNDVAGQTVEHNRNAATT